MKLLLTVLYIAAIGILAHYIGESLPRSIFIEDKFPFKAFRFEENGKIYEKIGIKKWKTKLPDMSRYMKDMLPKRVSFSASSDNIRALIKETCVAEFIHVALCVLSTGVYFIWKNTVGVILAAVCVICNLPFVIIQRYNRPHLINVENRMLRREKRKCEC